MPDVPLKPLTAAVAKELRRLIKDGGKRGLLPDGDYRVTVAEHGRVVRVTVWTWNGPEDVRGPLARLFGGIAYDGRPVAELLKLDVVASYVLRSGATTTRESVLS